MKKRRILAALLSLTLILVLLTGCGQAPSGGSAGGTSGSGSTGGSSGGTSGGAPSEPAVSAWTPPDDTTLICGGGIGGGQDTFIRSMALVLNSSGLVEPTLTCDNLTGGGGLVCIQSVAETMTGQDNVLMSGSGAIVPIEVANNTKLRQTDLTPIARMALETMTMVVAYDNTRINTMDDFIDIMKNDLDSITFGGNLPPAEDYLTMVMICNALGIDYQECNYVYFDGSGEVMPALLGGHIDVSFSGSAEWADPIEAKQVRPLAVAGEERLTSEMYKDTPTFIECGIDFTWQNWRGLLGPRDMPQEAVDWWVDTMKKASETAEWKDICDRILYEPGYLEPEGFQAFIEEYETKCEEALKTAGII